MSRSAKAEAVLALQRFGMGPRPGSTAAIEADPRGALIAELGRTPAELIVASALPSSATALRTVVDANAKRQARMTAAPAGMVDTSQGLDFESIAAKMATRTDNPGWSIYLEEASIRIDAALGAKIGFVERLVWFWSNHFCISADKIESMSGAYEREAIRPHVLGRFADMLLAVEGHPAMLVYLDNSASVGPRSAAGIKRSRGLNENLARETLELHTLGVRSGYTQDDVVSLANVLTGWTLVAPAGHPDDGGEFSFVASFHEPGAQKIMGKVYEDEGVDQGRAALRDLATHPATAVHLATKLASHFIADTPSPALVEKMANVFRASGGDLREVAKAMVSADESWTLPHTKLKRPSEWFVGMLRACGMAYVDLARFTAAQALLGEPLWRPLSPKGHPDDEASWIEGMARRLDIASDFAERVADPNRVDPETIMNTVLGSIVSAELKQAVGQAESRQQALALLFMSAEFQRR